MHKRGQVSVFAIIGIVALVAVIFVFILFRGFQEKAREITNPREYLQSQLGDIRKVVANCIGDESQDALDRLSLQGGHFNPTRYANYYGNKTSFLCYKVKSDEPCYNMMFTRQDIENELGLELERNILDCINLEPFMDKDYDLSTGQFDLDFVFSDRALLVTVDYPITLVRGNITEGESEFSKDTLTNFWGAAKLASDIVNIESKGENPDITKLSPKNMEFEISRTDIEGGSLYMIFPRIVEGNPFYFAVEK